MSGLEASIDLVLTIKSVVYNAWLGEVKRLFLFTADAINTPADSF